jgi:hypothetical protein
MATTTNYGWTTPDDTALVKDGAAAIRTLGSSVDTTTKALNPETTTGDIAYRSATANTNTRLALGTAGQVLTVNSGATAPEWATPAAPASPGMTFISRTSFTSAASVTLDNIFTSTYENYVVQIISDGGTSLLCMQGRVGSTTITSSDYTTATRMVDATGSASNFAFNLQTNWKINASQGTPEKGLTYLNFFRQTSSTRLRFTTTVWDDANIRGGAGGGTCFANNIYTGIILFPTSGNMTGTVTVYGMASA